MTNDWVRLGTAIAIIALISVSLYVFGGHAGAAEPPASTISHQG
jgi:hypothetical protein